MEQSEIKVSGEIVRDWEFVCLNCGRIAFSMASASKALFCRNCETNLVPVWFPINVPRYAVPLRVSAECPYCWEPISVALPEGRVPLGRSVFTCRHCLGKVAVNFRKHPIAVKKARSGK